MDREDFEAAESARRRRANAHRAPGEQEFRGYSGDDAGFAANYNANLKIRAAHERTTTGEVSPATDAALKATSLDLPVPDTTGLGGSQTVSGRRKSGLDKE